MSQPPFSPNHLRIADADRERATADLAEHYTAGRLEHEEYDERLDAIWTARTRADLDVLFRDLPALRPATGPVRPATKAIRPARRQRRIPLFGVMAALVFLSLITGTHLWLAIFVLLFVWGPLHGHRYAGPPAGRADYRRHPRSYGH